MKPDVGLLDMLGIFQEGQCHLAVVTADPSGAVRHLRAGHAPPYAARILGLVTLEDVLEKVIQGNITDETDRFGDNINNNHSNGSDDNLESPPKGVVTTTTLVRKISRSRTASSTSEFFSDSVLSDSVLDRRRSRSRGRSSSRGSLSILSSINVVAGDVRHKERDAVGATPRSRTSTLTPRRIRTAVDLMSVEDELTGVPRSVRSPDFPDDHLVGEEQLRQSLSEPCTPAGNFFDDVVDTHVVLNDEGESDCVPTRRGASGHPVVGIAETGDGSVAVDTSVGASGNVKPVRPRVTVRSPPSAALHRSGRKG